MKKLLSIVLAVSLMALTACGGSADSSTAGSKYVFKSGDTVIAANAKAEPIIAALGEPKNYHESESCAFKGLDKEYTYPGFVITTYPKDGVDYIYTVVLTDDTVSIPEGISIGSNETDVKAKLGDPTGHVGGAGYQYQDGDCEMLVVFDEDTATTVQSITYYAQVDIQ